MALWKCPGQDRRDFAPEDVILAPCPSCGAEIEFFPDDIMVRCSACKKLARNPRFNPACAAWCEYADRCLGEVAEAYRRQPEVLREKLLLEASRRLKDPESRKTALSAASYAAELSRREGGSPLVVTAAVLLREIAGACGQTRGVSQAEAAELAKIIMAKTGVPEETTAEIAEIVRALPGSGRARNINARLARDALRLAGWSQEIKGKNPEEISALAETFETAAGRELALSAASKRRG